METDKKIPSSYSPDKPASSGTGSCKIPGMGSRSTHGEARKEIVEEQNRIVSEAKEEAEKRGRDEAKETREKEDRANQKTNSGSS
jgi:predicted phage gp36 major capsid-like protein